jgi:hypothetical protein
MNTEFDHFFMFVKKPFHEESIITDAGFRLTKGNKHEGQGTQSKSILLEKEYVEFIWVNDQDETIRNPLKLNRRDNFEASPFGIGFRGGISESEKQNYWAYSPKFAHGSTFWINKFNESKPSVPLLFIMDLPSMKIEKPSDFWPINRFQKDSELLTHKSKSTKVVQIDISGPECESLNSIVSRVDPRLQFRDSDKFHVKIKLNGEFQTFSIGKHATIMC